MALRAVPRAGNSRMARSIDRNPAREFAAGYFERVSRRPVRQRTVAAGPASPPCRATPTLSTRRSAATISRKRRTKIPNYAVVEYSNLGAVSRSTARNEIDPGDGSLRLANRHPGYFRKLWRHRLRQKSGDVVVDVHRLQRRGGRRPARAARSTSRLITGMKPRPMRRCAASPSHSITPPRCETADRAILLRSRSYAARSYIATDFISLL